MAVAPEISVPPEFEFVVFEYHWNVGLFPAAVIVSEVAVLIQVLLLSG